MLPAFKHEQVNRWYPIKMHLGTSCPFAVRYCLHGTIQLKLTAPSMGFWCTTQHTSHWCLWTLTAMQNMLWSTQSVWISRYYTNYTTFHTVNIINSICVHINSMFDQSKPLNYTKSCVHSVRVYSGLELYKRSQKQVHTHTTCTCSHYTWGHVGRYSNMNRFTTALDKHHNKSTSCLASLNACSGCDEEGVSVDRSHFMLLLSAQRKSITSTT